MTNAEARMTNGAKPRVARSGAGEKHYDLDERTAKFGLAVIALAKSISRTTVTAPLISQLVRSGTSVGANYIEADDAGTRKEFRHRIFICKREARETKYWLRMLVAADHSCAADARRLWKEAKELHLIFAAIGRRTDEST
jgi:four helix bundle protein